MGRSPIAIGRRVATCAAVAVSSQFVVKCTCPVLGLRRRLPIGSNSTARLDNKSCACGVVVVVVVVERFRFELRIGRSNHCHRCHSRTELSWFVVTVPMMLLGHHRRHKLACCTGVAFDVVVLLSFCFMFFSRVVCVCCEVCLVVLYMFVCFGFVSNRLTLYRRISVT